MQPFVLQDDIMPMITIPDKSPEGVSACALHCRALTSPPLPFTITLRTATLEHWLRLVGEMQLSAVLS